MDRAFRANQSTAENIAVIDKYVNLGKKVKQETAKLRTAYTTLFKACFGTSTELQSIGDVPAYLFRAPKEIIPDINTIRFDTTTLRLGPIPGQRLCANVMQ